MSPADLPRALDLETIERARAALRGTAARTPLVRAPLGDRLEPLALKLELLQPIGSFKIRGAGAAMAAASPEVLARGVYTASAGNMAQGVAWCARARGIPCTVIVPETAPHAKIDAVERLGARVVRVPFAEWWQVLVDRAYPGAEGLFIHPVADRMVITGNATVALEILEDFPDVETVFVPFGGGGLACGIALGLRAAGSSARVVACEVDTAPSFSAALQAGSPVTIERRASFVDGIGGRGVLPEMWPLASRLLERAVVSSLAEVAAAIRLLAERVRVIAEGAGAASVAAAIRDGAIGKRAVAVVSGGNIDLEKLAVAVAGGVP